MHGVTFGCWVPIGSWDTAMIVGGRRSRAGYRTLIGFEMMVLGSLARFRQVRLVTVQRYLTVGYDARFSNGDYGVWVRPGPDRAEEASELLRRHGALEVRSER